MLLKKRKKKQKGEVTILFLLITFSLLGVIALTSLIIKKEIIYQNELIKKRKCLNKINQHHFEYVNKIEKLNLLIITANLIQLIPTTTLKITSVKKLIKLSQEIFYGIYILKNSTIKECHLSEIHRYLTPYPYLKKKGKFKRTKLGTIRKNTNKYQIEMCFKNINIQVKSKFRISLLGNKMSWQAQEIYQCI